MLQIKNISKTYKTGDLVQVALDDVSLNLRDNEFVAILGPSGSGKTTLLNIIGGLDRYDGGDLIINNVSTKKYKDRDWDSYRNHTIGFVFQSYNLIPHQTILANVELALTIAGVSKKERKARALQALDEVGLKDQAHKRPNQMSGGQMQRVAIARALINNPDILLADEPTGALDTQTSIQVMDLLKKVAKDRLVVMVTHNPELAEEYANRIVKLRDGHIISDTNPFVVETKEVAKHKKFGKASMNYLTALSLSFNNLLTKKGRTILTAFAGSIGIIGIALILSLSTGFQNYIDKIQEDTLSSYPLTITSDTADMTTAILSMVSDRRDNIVEGDKVRERQYLTTMFSSIGSNDLTSLKKYLERNEAEYQDDVYKIKYSYSVSPEIYSIDSAGTLAKLYPSSLWNTLYSNSASSFMSSFSSAGGGMIFSEMADDVETIYDQYDVLAGRWPEKFNEVIIVLSEPNGISDLLVYSLGLRDTAELRSIITSLMSQEEISVENKPLEFTYEQLMNIDLRLIKATDRYKYNSKYDIYEDMSEDKEFMNQAYEDALKLKVVGIVCAKEDGSTTALAPGVNFTSGLTKYVIDEARNTAIVQRQLKNRDVDVFSGDRFDEVKKEDEQKLNFEDMISVDEDMIKDAFKVNVSEDDFKVDMMSNDEMMEYIIKVSKNAAQEIAEVNVTETASKLGLLNSMMLPSVIDIFENAYVYEDGVKKLDLSNVDTFAETITKDFYKTSFIAIIENPMFSSFIQPFKQAASMFNDKDYENLANSLKLMFKEYYRQVSEATESQIVSYTVMGSGSNKVKTYGSLTALDKIIVSYTITNSTTNESNAYISKVALGMLGIQPISTSVGTATATITEPLVEFMTGLKDMFGEDMMSIDTDKFAQAFKFDLSEDELSRIMTTMMSGTQEKSYKSNLISLGFQDVDDPTSISFFFKDFESKENFIDFLDSYNDTVEEEKQISYTDITGILMSSVKTIVDSVTYVLIAFVSISLVVSSIMIAVITLISVMERTKEIGILRAMGASKHNVSSIFNAETFIIGLLSGLLGIGVTLLSIPPINSLIHNVTGNNDINAVLPKEGAIGLIIISVILTIVAGFIPSKKAAKQDPVNALRSE